MLLRTDKNVFASAWEMFMRYSERRLSFTDCISLAHIEDRNIKFILSYDSDFKGLAEYAKIKWTATADKCVTVRTV